MKIIVRDNFTNILAQYFFVFNDKNPWTIHYCYLDRYFNGDCTAFTSFTFKVNIAAMYEN